MGEEGYPEDYDLPAWWERKRHTIRMTPTGRFIIGSALQEQPPGEYKVQVAFDPGTSPSGVSYLFQAQNVEEVMRELGYPGIEQQIKDRIHRLTEEEAAKAKVFHLDACYPGIEERTLERYVDRDVELTYEIMYGEENKVRDPEVLRRQAYKMLQEADFYESIPSEDPFEVGTVIKFHKRFVGSTVPHYHFAALKVEVGDNEVWFVTGARQAHQQFTWPQLIELIGIKGLQSAVVMQGEKLLSDVAKEMAPKDAIESPDLEKVEYQAPSRPIQDNPQA